MVDIEVLSKEIIKPSSPTAHHLRHYQLSSMDQIMPSYYISFVHFYEFNGETQPTNITEISNHLKKSLAEVLTLFYPLAGRINKDNLRVDCNDEGIPYLKAQVKGQLSDFLKDPNIVGELNKLIPFELDDSDNEFALGVQLNIFECGGFAISHCMSHKVGDGSSTLMFSKIWAAIARGDQAKIDPPEYVAATLFPPIDLLAGFDSTNFTVTKKKVTKRFVFDGTTIEDLRAKYGNHVQQNSNQQLMMRKPLPPSRVETLSAFLWSRCVAATRGSGPDENSKLYGLGHVVNLRPRFDPSLSQHSFGNLSALGVTFPSLDTEDDQCYGLMGQVRKAISMVDKDYIKLLQHPDETLRLVKKIESSMNHGEILLCSSLCRFPMYGNDFGWGRPIWVGFPALPQKGIFFIDTKEGQGIEAYISITEEGMAKLERDTQFLQRVGPGCQPIRFNRVANSNSQNLGPNIIKKHIHTKPVKLGSMLSSLIKLLKRR